MHTRAFQGLKARLGKSQVVPHHISITKSFYKIIGSFYQNMLDEDLRHAFYAYFKSSATIC